MKSQDKVNAMYDELVDQLGEHSPVGITADDMLYHIVDALYRINLQEKEPLDNFRKKRVDMRAFTRSDVITLFLKYYGI